MLQNYIDIIGLPYIFWIFTEKFFLKFHPPFYYIRESKFTNYGKIPKYIIGTKSGCGDSGCGDDAHDNNEENKDTDNCEDKDDISSSYRCWISSCVSNTLYSCKVSSTDFVSSSSYE